MIKEFKVDKNLADSVEKELNQSHVYWKYFKHTLSEYNKIENYMSYYLLKDKYGPIIDTQRFTDIVYSLDANVIFREIRKNPNSRYNLSFPQTSKLIDEIQFRKNIIPNTHRVKRIFINMFTIRPTWQLNLPHIDSNIHSDITVLYYVNDSDGDTYFFEKDKCIKQVSPVKGNGVVFPSFTVHAGAVPIKHETRIGINIVFGL